MLQWFTFLKYSTYGVYFLECSSVFLILSPFLQPYLRVFTLAALAGLHLNFDLCMRLGIFPWVDIVSLTVLLPPETMDWFARRFDTSGRRGLRLFYDGECGFCRKMVLLLREFLLLPKDAVAKAQDDPTAAKLLEKEFTWVVVDAAGQYHIRWDAWVTAIEQTPLLGGLFRRLPLRSLTFIGDPAYTFVAHRRAALGRYSAKYLPERDLPDFVPSNLLNLVTLFFIGYVGLWNIKTVPRFGIDIASPWSKIASVLRLDQKWNMFAPYPLREDGWYVIDGELTSGKKVDVLRHVDGQVSFDKPELVSAMFTNARWRKYLMGIYPKSKKDHRLYYGKYLCRSWNEKVDFDDRLSKFQIYFMKERNVLPGVVNKVEKNMIWQHDCFKKKAKDDDDDED